MSESCLCRDCSVGVRKIGEFAYMLTSEIWNRIAPGHSGISTIGYFLCISCVEKRLNRELMDGDFSMAPLNWWPTFSRSELLTERLSRQEFSVEKISLALGLD